MLKVNKVDKLYKLIKMLKINNKFINIYMVLFCVGKEFSEKLKAKFI